MRLFSSKSTMIGLLMLVGLALSMSGGCAQDVPDIDRTQPRGLQKSIFRLKNEDGTLREWFFRQTVVDVPYGSAATFIGEQGDTEKIVWEITERFLYAYRSREYVINTEKSTQRPQTGDYKGTAIAAFRIESHFDIQRSYNPATGEQTNVLVENMSDRPWHERKHMRVDFGKNLVNDFRFVASSVKQQPIGYYIPETETENKDRAKIGDNYIDLVHKMFIQPETHAFLSSYYGRPIPSCWLYSNISQDCLGQSIKLRSSFMLAPKKKTYKAKLYDNRRMQKFGYFRTIRYGYDRRYGETEDGTKFYVNRFNLWKDEATCVDSKAKLTHAKCKMQPIAYHVNQRFPADLKEASKGLFDEWNKNFREVVKRLSGKDQGDVFVFCPNNPVKQGDPAVCGKPDTSPQIGDLRYNMLYWVDAPQRYSPLGYGPSAADPNSGQIMSANSFIYGAALDSYANYATDLVRLVNGDLKAADIGVGKHVLSYLKNIGSLKERSRFKWKGSMTAPLQLHKHKHFHAKGQEIKERVRRGQMSFDYASANLRKLKDAPNIEALINSEVFKAFGLHALSPSGQVNDAVRQHFGPHVMANRAFFKWSQDRVKRLSGKNVLMADFMDDSILARALKMKKAFADSKGKVDYNKVYAALRRDIFYAVALHEVGHNLGLRHNFAGSSDALNFHDKYWDLRSKTVPAGANTPLPEYRYDEKSRPLLTKAIQQGMREYQYSSIMDYGASFATDLHGLGKYDRAAILYGYGDMVEVFKKGSTTMTRAKAAQQLGPGDWHYTQIPSIIGGANKNISEQIKALGPNARTVATISQLDKDKSLVEVPYRFCSDEYVGGIADCYRFDQGPDAYERVRNTADRYWSYYIFDAFKRGRLRFGMNPQAYMSRIYNRYFTPITDQYKHFVNDAFVNDENKKCGGGSNWYSNPQCGEHTLMAAIAGLNFFGRVLQIPNVGCYERQQGVNGTRFEHVSQQSCKEAISDFGKKPKNQYLDVPLGTGRPMMSQFNFVQNGYQFNWKPLNYGAWWDKYLAVMALGDPYTRFIGVDSTANPRSFLINYTNFFGRYVNNLVGGFIAGRSEVYAPIVTLDGKMRFRDVMPITGTQNVINPRPDWGLFTAIDPDEQYTAKLMAGYLSAVYFSGDTNDQYMNQSLKISVRGLSESPEVSEEVRKDPNQYVELIDKDSQRVYYAVRVENQHGPFSSAPDFFSIGFEYLKWMKDRYYQADGKTLKAGVESWRVRRDFHYINIMMGWVRAGEYNRPR